eukprot:406088_1
MSFILVMSMISMVLHASDDDIEILSNKFEEECKAILKDNDEQRKTPIEHKTHECDVEEPPKKKRKLNKCKKEWNDNEVAEWVMSLGGAYEQYGEPLVYSSIDGELMNELDRESLSEIVTNKVHCIKILLEWKKLN